MQLQCKVFPSSDLTRKQSFPVILLFVLSVPFIPIFIFYESRVAKNPVLDLHLFESRNLCIACLLSFISGTAHLTPILLFPLYLSAIKSIPQRTSNVITLTLILAFGTTPFLSAHILSKTRFSRFRLTALTASIVYALGASLTLTLSPSTPFGVVLAYSLLLGAGAGAIAVPAALLGPLSGAPHQVASVITLLSSCHALGAAGSTILIADLLASEFVRALRAEGLRGALEVVGGARLAGLETLMGTLEYRAGVVRAVVSGYRAANVPGVVMGAVYAAALVALRGLDVRRTSKKVVDVSPVEGSSITQR